MDNLINEKYELDNDWETLGTLLPKTQMISTDDTDNKEIDTDSKIPNHRKVILSPVVTLQLVICLLALTVIYVFKTFFIPQFEDAKMTFDKEITSSMFFDGKIADKDYGDLFGATDDEI